MDCKSVLVHRFEAPFSTIVSCPCGAEIKVSEKQLNEAAADRAGERLWGDDEAAQERILAIDLGVYDELVTYPLGVEWEVERRKILFLQTALRLDIPWAMVVQFTSPYFGQRLWSPLIPVTTPINPQSFIPPAFDIARQTVGQWAEAADEAWKAYRVHVARGLADSRKQLIQDGKLREFDRPRQATRVQGQAKAPIVDESTAYIWAVQCFFTAQCGARVSWAAVAENELQVRKFKGSPTERARLKRKIAEQVRTNVTNVLRALGMPE